MRYALGLDIGVASVGWGIIDLDTSLPVKYGVRLFKEANAEDNLKRRTARGGRRLKRRRTNRINDLKNILKEENLLNDDFKYIQNPYEIRKKGLTEKLTNNELCAALLHIAKHRGNSLDVVEDDQEKAKENASTKKILSENDQLLKKGLYICEIQLNRLVERGYVRGNDNNFRTVDYEKEVKQILSNQNIDESTQQRIITCITRKREYYEGPGSFISQSPYGVVYDNDGNVIENMIEKMTGKCSIFPNELRAPKMSYSAELFNLLNDLNNLNINGEKISVDTKKQVIEIVNNKGGITPKQLAKLLDCELAEITGFRINKNEEPLLTEFKGYKLLKKTLDNIQPELLNNKVLLDNIAQILSQTKGITDRKERILALSEEINNSTATELSLLNGFTGTHSLSFKAIYLMNEELLNTELNQMQILHLSNKFEFSNTNLNKHKIELDPTAILSPVARQSIQQAFKVINELIKKYGHFESIAIETTRDKNSSEQQKRIRETQKYNELVNKKVIDVIGDKIKLNGKLKEKIRLYLDQDGKCAYTLEKIDLSLLLSDSTAYEVDHIIPISISMDDSYNNKVLVTHKANQQKGNMTPFMAFMNNRFDSNDYTQFKANVLNLKNSKHISRKKCEYLLFEKDINKFETMKEFINRNLVDTSYANRVILNSLQTFFKNNNIDTKVFTVKGSVTHQFRKRIKLDKDREDNYAHHGIDALIIASLVKQQTIMNALNSFEINDGLIAMNDTGEVIEINDESYFESQFISLVQRLYRLDEVNKNWDSTLDLGLKCNFSWKVDKKPNRQLSDETIYSTRIINNEEKVVKKYKNIYDPKWCVLANDIMNDEYQNKYLMYLHDPKTFEKMIDIVKNYFEDFKNDSTKIKYKGTKVEFQVNPLYEYYQEHGKVTKYSKKNNGPEIDSLKYLDGKLGNCIDITHKYDNGITKPKGKHVVLQQISPYRTDFYLDNGMYKFVTVRYSNIRYINETEKYVIDKSWYEDQLVNKKISSNAKFLFSLHHDELVEIADEKGKKLYRFTATKADSKNVIEVKPIHTFGGSRITPTIGKKIKSLRKLSTNSIGDIYEIRNEQLKFEF